MQALSDLNIENPLSKRDKFWSDLPIHTDGGVAWPEDQDERRQLATDVVGARIIGAIEAVLENRLRVVAGEKDDVEENAARGEVFASMTDDQRAAVEGLLRSVCFNSLYWMLVKLKDCPDLCIDISAQPYSEGKPLAPLGLNETELHFLYFDWIEKFSDHRDGG